MKLLRLKIDDKFRSLDPGFEVVFSGDKSTEETGLFMPYCFVGLNGSGKSNVLEALAMIFYHIECMYLKSVPEGFLAEDIQFENNIENELYPNLSDPKKVTNSTKKTEGFRREVSEPDAFELEYLINVNWKKGQSISDVLLFNDISIAHIKIVKEKEKAPEIVCINFDSIEEKAISIFGLYVKDILPEYIIGYSSGENEILSLPFFKMRVVHYDEYATRLVKELDYGFQPEGRLIFMDSLYSQSVFLSNYLFQSADVLKPIMDTIGIGEIKEFRLIINTDKIISNLPSEDNLEPKNRSKDYKKFPVIDLLKDKVNFLKNCSTCHYKDYERGFLYLDYYVTDATKDAFQMYFGSALDFFWTIQMLFTLNFYHLNSEIKKRVYHSKNLYLHSDVISVSYDEERIIRIKDFTIGKKGTDEIMYTKSLSDGEHQFLHSLGLCILFKGTNSLFLLDEPETHFNPDWRAKFISTLRNCLLGDIEDVKSKNVTRELLITSHSPFIISDCHEDNVLIFSKNSVTQKVSYSRPNFNTFGASVNKITMKVFGKTDTIGDLAKESISDLYTKLESGSNKNELAIEADNILGDSVEKILLMKNINE